VKPYIRIGDHSHPTIILNKEKNLFLIRGRSFPENAEELFKDTLQWLEEYAKNPNDKTVFTIKLYYYNSATARKLLEIFDILEKIKKSGKQVVVQWYYQEEDDVIRENGEDFALLFDIDFELISYPEKPKK
jgi:O-glycosyl hydrolase